MRKLAAVILAAGLGKRMKSKIPKVLHKICGRSIGEYIIEQVNKLEVDRKVVIIGRQGDKIRRQFGDELEYVEQREQLGTGHAALQAEKVLGDFEGDALILPGDTPLLTSETLRMLIKRHRGKNAVATLLTAKMSDPTGYGRIVRNFDGSVRRIVEEKEASLAEKGILEVNVSIYCFKSEELFQALKQISPDNEQGEYYLTDVIEVFTKENLPVEAIQAEDGKETMGINTRIQLAEARKILQRRILDELMLGGVSIVDPESTYIDGGVIIGQDTIIYPSTIIERGTVIGEDCIIGPSAHLIAAKIGDRAIIRSSTIVDREIRADTVVGPYAYLG